MLNPEANPCVNVKQDVFLPPIERGYMLFLCNPPPPPHTHTHTRFLVITIKFDRNRNMILLNIVNRKMLTLGGSRKMYKYVYLYHWLEFPRNITGKNELLTKFKTLYQSLFEFSYSG